MLFTMVASACSRGEVASDSTGSTVPIDLTVETTTTETTAPSKHREEDAAFVLEWTEAGLSGETFIHQLIATDHGFIAYRFFDEPQAWVSEDGIVWTATNLVSDLSDDHFFLSDITAVGPKYVAISGFFHEDNLLWTSEDGLTWSRQELDLEQPDLSGYESGGLDPMVGGPRGFVIQGSLYRVGVDEHRFVVWTSLDGSTWDLVEDPFGPGAYVGEILPTSEGFVTQGYVEGSDVGERIWWSPDGRSWEESPVDFLGNGIYAELELVRWGDKILAVVQTEHGIRLWTSTGGRTWDPLSAGPSLERTGQSNMFVTEIVVGPLGIVLMAQLESPGQPMPPVVIEKDGFILTVDLEAFRVTVTDATGEVLLEGDFFDPGTTVVNEDDSITLLHPDSGEALVTVTPEEFEEAQAKAFQEAGIDDPRSVEPQLTAVLFFSPDGRHWTSVKMEEIIGSVGFPQGIVVGDDALILRFGYAADGEDFEDESEADIYGDEPDVIWVGRLTDE